MSRLFFFPLLLVPALAFAPPRGDEDAARAFARDWVAAYNAHDGLAFSRLYADGAVVVWPDGGGVVVEDRTAFEAGSAEHHVHAAGHRIDAAPAAVRLLPGGGAVVTVVGTYHADGEAFPTSVMLVLERAGESWRIAAEHGQFAAGG